MTLACNESTDKEGPDCGPLQSESVDSAISDDDVASKAYSEDQRGQGEGALRKAAIFEAAQVQHPPKPRLSINEGLLRGSAQSLRAATTRFTVPELMC